MYSTWYQNGFQDAKYSLISVLSLMKEKNYFYSSYVRSYNYNSLNSALN